MGEMNYKFIEDRCVNPPCSIGEHDRNMLEDAVWRVSDCKYVLCNRIGSGASKLLLENGIHSYEMGDYIESSLNRLWYIVNQ